MGRAQRGFTLIEMMVVIAIISILVALAVNMRITQYGASASSVADSIVSRLEFARMRAISTRHGQRVTITNNKVTVLNGDQSGMVAPTTYTELQQLNIPNAVTIWDFDANVDAASGHTVGAINSTLSFNIDFRPDGSSTGGTVFLTDAQHTHDFRVIAYKVTGSVFARSPW